MVDGDRDHSHTFEYLMHSGPYSGFKLLTENELLKWKK